MATTNIPILGIYCHIDLTDAPIDGRKPVVARWDAIVYDWHTPGEHLAEVVIYDADYNQLARFRTDEGPVPAWVPRPPDGWDLGVRIQAERRLIEAEQSEQVPA